MTTNTEQTQAELVHVDPTTLHIGVNVREAHLDKPFIASIRERGVLVPIVATRDDDGHLVVQYGQRRTLAAVEVGRESVPVMVLPTDPDEADRIIDQLGENDHRAAITNTERVAAVEQLSLLGLSAGQIAKRTATHKNEVAHALTVAQSATARTAADGGLSLTQAAALTEFEDDEALIQQLIEKAEHGGFEHAVERARQDRKDAAEIAHTTAELTEAGVNVIPVPDYDDRTIHPLDRLRQPDSKESLTAETHAECEGHAAYVQRGWNENGPRITYVCTNAKQNGHIDRYGSAVAASGPMTEEQKAERKQVIENNKAWDASTVVRRAWLAEFAQRKSAPKGAEQFIAQALIHGDSIKEGGTDKGHSLYLASSGTQTADSDTEFDYGHRGARDALTAKIEAATPKNATMIALCMILAAWEEKTDRQTWRTPSPTVRRYLAAMVQWGYEPSELEQQVIDHQDD